MPDSPTGPAEAMPPASRAPEFPHWLPEGPPVPEPAVPEEDPHA